VDLIIFLFAEYSYFSKGKFLKLVRDIILLRLLSTKVLKCFFIPWLN